MRWGESMDFMEILKNVLGHTGSFFELCQTTAVLCYLILPNSEKKESAGTAEHKKISKDACYIGLLVVAYNLQAIILPACFAYVFINFGIPQDRVLDAANKMSDFGTILLTLVCVCYIYRHRNDL